MLSFDCAKLAIDSSSRALNLLDRFEFSSTYGCFDRYFWHFKTSDFPSASYQMGGEYLARLWAFDHPDNVWFQNEKMLNYAKSAFFYTFQIQNSDGSFDEWYPNERGWAGPTSYVCHSLYESFKILKPYLNAKEIEIAISGFLLAGRFLKQRDEGEVLTNHVALYLLSLAEITELTESSEFEEDFEKGLKMFLNYTSEEGWSLEYDGADFGYALGTLSFLARLHRIRPLKVLEEYAEKCFEFLSYVTFPDGSVGAGLGSRSTVHLYPLALSYWQNFSSVAQRMLYYFVEINKFQELKPADQDDHYLFYRLSEYLEVGLLDVQINETKLPFEKELLFEKYFSDSGIRLIKRKKSYVVIAEKRGGALAIFDIQKRQCVHKNFGWVIRDYRSNMYTSLWNQEACILREGVYQIKSEGVKVPEKYFSPLKMVIFRTLMMCFGRTSRTAYFIKRIIRKLLITPSKSSRYSSVRSIKFESGTWSVLDTIHGTQERDRVYWGGEFIVRYVPQSKYVSHKDSSFFMKEVFVENNDVIEIFETISVEGDC